MNNNLQLKNDFSTKIENINDPAAALCDLKNTNSDCDKTSFNNHVENGNDQKKGIEKLKTLKRTEETNSSLNNNRVPLIVQNHYSESGVSNVSKNQKYFQPEENREDDDDGIFLSRMKKKRKKSMLLFDDSDDEDRMEIKQESTVTAQLIEKAKNKEEIEIKESVKKLKVEGLSPIKNEPLIKQENKSKNIANDSGIKSKRKRKSMIASDRSDSRDEELEDSKTNLHKRKKAKVEEQPVSKEKKQPKKSKNNAIKEEPEKVVKTEPKLSKSSVKKEEPKLKTEQSKRVKKQAEADQQEEAWKWWEEQPHPDGALWLTLEHNGPYFPPNYVKLPEDVKFYYDGKMMKLSLEAEEMATFYSKMLDHEYTSKDIFNRNFFEDWRKVMTAEEKKIITDLKKCNFKEIHAHFLKLSEEKRAMSKEEKEVVKAENAKITDIYGYCIMDGHKQKVGNFRIEPPGLFRGRGDHPKQGRLKLRVQPEDIIINIGKESKIPDPPEGHKWKSIQHDNKVSWLASWVENIVGSYKYVMLNPTAKIKGEKDMAKFDVARKLKDHIDSIRQNYKKDWDSEDLKISQRGVCLYLIDKLALRAGHEKEEGETADTVGCCSLRVEHIKLHKEMDDQKYVVEFDFLGKDSVRYVNKVAVKKKVFRNLKKFQVGKAEGTDLFDQLTTSGLNRYLGELMPGLTAKVFRTYNASSTLQDQLGKLTEPSQSVGEKILSYNRANRAVAILCNHQRAVSKNFSKSMENLNAKISEKKKEYKELKKEISSLKAESKDTKSNAIEKAENKIKKINEQLLKLNIMITEKDENKTIALGTSKLNYLDPRITVAWCRKHDVPIEKVFPKTHREKFQWAIDMAGPDFVF